MAYSTPNDCRIRTVGVTTLVVPDVSSTALNLTVCIAEADAEIDEAARAGDYEAPLGDVNSTAPPTRIRNLSAIGAIAKARRALDLGQQKGEGGAHDLYQREFARGLELLREGRMDLGAVSVSSEGVTMASDYETWAPLAHAGVVMESVSLQNAAGALTYTEDRSAFDPAYLPDAVKDYEVNYVQGKVRRCSGGRIAVGQEVRAAYQYFWRQPGSVQDSEYAGRTARGSAMRRDDYQR